MDLTKINEVIKKGKILVSIQLPFQLAVIVIRSKLLVVSSHELQKCPPSQVQPTRWQQPEPCFAQQWSMLMKYH